MIATKGGITRQGPAKTEYVGRAGYLIQCVEMSLRRLKLERIELYQLHRIDPRTPLEESLGALRQMQEQGKIRHIGMSEVNVEQIELARTMVEVATVQNRYSLADRRHEKTLQYCESEGIGFMPWYPLSGRQDAAGGRPREGDVGGDCGAAWRNRGAAFHCVAAAPVAGDDAHSGDVKVGPSGRKHGRGVDPVECGGLGGSGSRMCFLSLN